MSNTAKFTMIDENFICEVCEKEVKKLGYIMYLSWNFTTSCN